MGGGVGGGGVHMSVAGRNFIVLSVVGENFRPLSAVGKSQLIFFVASR